MIFLLLFYIKLLIEEKFNEYENPPVCFITAIYSTYETSCKKFVTQTIKSDFICFTDNENIESNGWTIDTTPYHYLNPSKLDNGNYLNSLKNNTHTFNIGKYYKQAFRNIPRLKKYKVIIWLDGTIEITNENVSKYILDNIYDHLVIGWAHEYSNGLLSYQCEAVKFDPKYADVNWNNQKQPYQDLEKHYKLYLKKGYDEDYFKQYNIKNFGTWVTCFVAFLNDDIIDHFLNFWYLQTLTLSTQDQLSFSYVCQKTKLIPFTLPNADIAGSHPHTMTDFYIKHPHGK